MDGDFIPAFKNYLGLRPILPGSRALIKQKADAMARQTPHKLIGDN